MVLFFFFFKQKTAYEMRISDWSSDVCSSDLDDGVTVVGIQVMVRAGAVFERRRAGARLGLGLLRKSLQAEVGRATISVTKGQRGQLAQIGRASCRERVCKYV